MRSHEPSDVARRALVIGGGIAGLSTAISMRQAGWHVDIVEKNLGREVYHVGIIVQSNFMRALDRLGCAESAIERGFGYGGFDLCNLDGDLVAHIPGVALSRESHPTDLGLTRPALHDVLLSRAAEVGVQPRYGETFTGFVQTELATTVTFTKGASAAYDLVVAADGLYSSVRTELFERDLKPRYTGQAVWRYNMSRPPDVLRTAMYQGGSGGKAGYCPLTADTMYLLLVMREPGNPYIAKSELAAAFKSRLAQFGGRIGQIRDSVAFDPDKIVYRPLEAIFVPAPWFRGRVLLIGDAAHGTTPHLGQGAAQAVEDAVVLGEIATENIAVHEILERFMSRRFERCKMIWDSSIQIGQWEIDDDFTADVAALSRRILQNVSDEI